MRHIYFYIILLFPIAAIAQGNSAVKYDYNWLFGVTDGGVNGIGNSLLNFENNLPDTSYLKELQMPFLGFNISQSDIHGSFSFATNGICFINADYDTLTNGNTFYIDSDATNFYDEGYPAPQGNAIVLPFQNDIYYLVHLYQISTNVPRGVRYTKINMQEMPGEVIAKNQNLKYCQPTRISAARHANGRDWWVIVPPENEDKYYRWLLSPYGFSSIDSQSIETQFIEPDYGTVNKFSADGSIYIRYDNNNFIRIYDFDRCSGLLSNPRHIPYNVPQAFGMEISANNRFLYISDYSAIVQFDLQAINIEASMDTVAVYDGFTDPFATGFFSMQLAPDGKIYCITTNGSAYLHRIEFPNKQGDNCMVKQHSVKIPTPTIFSIPYYPNYRLGPLDGSSCDTLGIDNIPVADFRHYRYDSTDWHSVTFSNLSYYEPSTWSWEFGDGNSSNDYSPLHYYAQAGDYQACLTVSNQYGSDTRCDTVHIEPFTATNTIVDTQTTDVLYPNPFQSHLNLLRHSSEALPAATLSLYDLTGRVVWERPLAAGVASVSFYMQGEALPSGVYVAVLHTQGVQQWVKRVVKW